MFRRDQAPYLSDASFDAIGRFCRKLKIYWRYDLPIALSAELKRKAARRETCSVTINLLELVGMVLTAWVMHELVGDRPESKRDSILMRVDNFAAVTWANQCGGARDKLAGLMMRMLGRLEIQGGWRYGPVQRFGGDWHVTILSPFWEGTARKLPQPGTYLTNLLIE